MLLKVRQCDNRYLTFRTIRSDSESCARNENLLQDWSLGEPDLFGYRLIESSQARGYFLTSPNIEGRPAKLSQTKEDLKVKWKFVDVRFRYAGHPAPNFTGCIFLMSRLIPLQNNTGKRARMKEHELGVTDERIDNGAPIILWHHKGIYCSEPRNQIWTLV